MAAEQKFNYNEVTKVKKKFNSKVLRKNKILQNTTFENLILDFSTLL